MSSSKDIMQQAIRLPWHILWLAGALTFYFIKGVGYLRLKRLLRCCHELTDRDVLFRAMTATKTDTDVRVLSCSGLSTALTFGIFHPVILLPNPILEKDRLYMSLVHELTHIKQHDLLLKLLALVVQGLNWFNPLTYLMTSDLDESCELLCDRRVIDVLGDDNIKAYCSLLIDTAANPPIINVTPSAGLVRPKKSIKRRIYSIMNKRLSRPVCGAAVAILVLCLCVLGVACSPVVKTQSPTSDIPGAVFDEPHASSTAKSEGNVITISSTDSTFSISLPDWMETQKLGYAQEWTDEGCIITAYVLEPAPDGADVPD